MKDMLATSIRYSNQCLEVLDQHQLPHQEIWRPCRTTDEMISMIQRLQIRGAPLIGIGASLLLADLAEKGMDTASLKESAAHLRAARPTAVNLMNCLDRMIATLDTKGPSGLAATAEAMFQEDIELCSRMSEHGATLFNAHTNLLTHCNTGSLATAGSGTAIGVIAALQAQNKHPHVYVDETRPLLQGGRLTVWEMEKLAVEHTLICDNMAATLMAQGKVDAILVGSDRIAANGDFANKVGTYSLAVNAHFHNVPFYVVAPYTTVDPTCPNGESIPIEERSAAEVQGVSGSFGDVSWSLPDTPVYNPAFDVTPAKLVTGWILDKGVYSQEEISQGVLRTLS